MSAEVPSFGFGFNAAPQTSPTRGERLRAMFSNPELRDMAKGVLRLAGHAALEGAGLVRLNDQGETRLNMSGVSDAISNPRQALNDGLRAGTAGLVEGGVTAVANIATNYIKGRVTEAFNPAPSAEAMGQQPPNAAQVAQMPVNIVQG